jgi:hypothetical protein
VITFDTDASSSGVTTPPLWHIDAVGGRPPHQLSVGISAKLPLCGAAHQVFSYSGPLWQSRRRLFPIAICSAWQPPVRVRRAKGFVRPRVDLIATNCFFE